MDDARTGGCLCGAIRYRILAAPVEALFCHCRMCQRAHGAPVVAWLAVPSAGFEMTAGEAAAYRSSSKALRQFCATCGTPLTWRAIDNPRLVDVSIATLDEPAAAAPDLHLWTRHRLAWLELADRLPRYSTNRRG
jgi:hypothetical protein